MSKQFSNTTEYNGLIQECEDWIFGGSYGSISSNEITLKRFTSFLNYGLDEVTMEIMKVDNFWQWDDTNHPDTPIATATLVEGQQDYTLDITHLSIEGVEVKDSNGDFYRLTPVDYRQIRNSGQTPTEFFEQDGRPIFYDTKGETISLYPAPRSQDVTTTAGLKIHFKRPASYFSYTDTVKTPGFSPIFHDLIALYACAKYAKQNQLTDKARELDNEISKRKKLLTEHYAQRQIDTKKKITYKYKNPK